jgi:hypothetical protein
VFDEHDHRALDELEQNLAREDPDFVGRFRCRQALLGAPVGRRLGDRVAVGVAVTAGVLLLLLGSPGGALAAVLTTGLVWWGWRQSPGFIWSRST